MDGTRTQADIARETSIQKSHLSTLVKQLRDRKLVDGDAPKLTISVPTNFFDINDDNE
jgi:hypothetical protein